MKNPLLALLLACAVAAVGAGPQEDPAHAELRAVRDGLVDCMNKGDIDGQLVFLHPNVVVTWHNAEVSRGREGVKAYLNRTLRGPSKIVETYHAQLNVDELSILYGETAIAFGSVPEHFTLTNGHSLDLTGRWTATLAKDGGKWLVTSLHISDNLFDNPMLNKTRTAWQWISGGALAVGLLGGWLLGRMRRRAA